MMPIVSSPRPRPPLRPPLGRLTPLLALLLLAGCAANGVGNGPSPTSTTPPIATATPVPKAQMQAAQTNVTKPNVNGGTFDATATCPAGTTLVSGGFADGSAEGATMAVRASYPSAANAWTVTVFTVGGPLNFSAYADCIQANFPVTAQIASAGGATAVCPASTTLTGGGYKGAGVSASRPAGNGWQATVQGGSASLQVYAVCANSNLSAGGVPSASVAIPALGDKKVEVGCAAGQTLVGGGFSSPNRASAYVSLPKPDFETWIVQATFIGVSDSSDSISSHAVCVKLTPHP